MSKQTRGDHSRQHGRHVVAGKQLATPLATSVFEDLKRDVLSGALAPGTILVENAQAERFGVSKGPVREALKRLVGLGFLHAMPRVGYMVTGIKIADLDEIFDVRLAIEPAAVRLAMERASVSDLIALEALAAREPAAKNEPAGQRGSALVDANRDFHVEIARLSGNSRFERIISSSIDELERVIQLLALNLDEEPDEHPELVQVMRSGDVDAAAENMRAQLAANHSAMRAAAVRSRGSHDGRHLNLV